MAARQDLDRAALETRPGGIVRPAPADLYDAGSVDLISMRLVLQQHLAELRSRGIGEDVLRPIEAELRRYDQTVDQLVEGQQRPDEEPGLQGPPPETR
jgi:hypothetical protein